jgi:NodT family efflux transporter outer membrane factor (OMF) lipoprotein
MAVSAGTIVGATAAALLAGCGAAPPVRHPELPAAELPEDWTAPAAPGSTAAWWTSFGDERVRPVVEEALAHNHDLAQAAARLEAAAAEAKIAGADVLPTMNARGNAARQQQVITFLRNPQTGAPITSTTNNYGVALDVSWEVDLWGRLRSQRSAAAADLQAAAADWAAARLSIAAQAMKAWFAAVEAGRQAGLAQQTVASYERTVHTVESRYESGVRPSIDVRLARADLEVARAALQARNAARDRALRQLEVLLGRYPAATVDVAGELTSPPGEVPAGLPADLLARRPDLAAAERRLAAANRRVAASRRALLPRLSLTSSGGRSSDELGDLLDGDFSVWSLAANLLQPLFQGGRLRAEVRRSEAVEDAAVAAWANDVLRACAEVETLLAAESFLAAQERAQAAAAEQARAAHDLAQERYEAGLDDVVTLLAAQRSAAQAESALLQVRRARLTTRVDLHLALGGDFDTGRAAVEGPAAEERDAS